MTEHDKLRLVADKSQACGELLDWLVSSFRKGLTLAKYHRHDDRCDQDGERRCGLRQDELIPVPFSIKSLLAEFFGIDESKLEDEKRAILADIAAKSKADACDPPDACATHRALLDPVDGENGWKREEWGDATGWPEGKWDDEA